MMAVEGPGFVPWAVPRLADSSVAVLTWWTLLLLSFGKYKRFGTALYLECISWAKCVDLYATEVVYFCNLSDYFIVTVPVTFKKESWYKTDFTFIAKYGNKLLSSLLRTGEQWCKSRNITVEYRHWKGKISEIFFPSSFPCFPVL